MEDFKLDEGISSEEEDEDEDHLNNVNWRFRNVEESHSDRWQKDATRMLDEIIEHQ